MRTESALDNSRRAYVFICECLVDESYRYLVQMNLRRTLRR